MSTPVTTSVNEFVAPPTTAPRILIAGIGNIFLGDDAFGVEVAQRLAARGLPPEARVVDFGIRGLDLTYALLDNYEAVILVDACPRGGAPGTLYVVEAEWDPANVGDGDSPVASLDPHSMDPVKVLRLAAAMGSRANHVLLVGCEPSPVLASDDTWTDMTLEMSSEVQSAIDPAAAMVESLVARLLAGRGETS